MLIKRFRSRNLDRLGLTRSLLRHAPSGASQDRRGRSLKLSTAMTKTANAKRRRKAKAQNAGNNLQQVGKKGGKGKKAKNQQNKQPKPPLPGSNGLPKQQGPGKKGKKQTPAKSNKAQGIGLLHALPFPSKRMLERKLSYATRTTHAPRTLFPVIMPLWPIADMNLSSKKTYCNLFS